MDKSTACHMLADYNEAINDYYDDLRKMELCLYTCSENEKDWYLEKIEETKTKIANEEQERDEFVSQYHDFIYS